MSPKREKSGKKFVLPKDSIKCPECGRRSLSHLGCINQYCQPLRKKVAGEKSILDAFKRDYLGAKQGKKRKKPFPRSFVFETGTWWDSDVKKLSGRLQSTDPQSPYVRAISVSDLGVIHPDVVFEEIYQALRDDLRRRFQ